LEYLAARKIKTPGPGQYEVLKARESKYTHPDSADWAIFKSGSPRIAPIKSFTPSPSISVRQID
jgi:hypothetical protein